MTHSIQATYNEKIIKKGVAAYIWYRLRTGFGYFGFAILLVLFPSLLIADQFGWFQYLYIGFVAFVVFATLLAYGMVLRVRLTRFRQMQNPVVTMTMHEGGLDVSSSLGASSQPWSYLTGILKKPEFWLLFSAGNNFIVLPVEGASLAALDYLTEKVPVKK